MENARDPSTATDPAIAASRRTFADRLTGGDARAACLVYSEDALFVPPTADLIRGREAIEAFWRAGIDAGLVSLEADDTAITQRETVAFEVGLYAMEVRSPSGPAVAERGTYLLVHERQGDRSWRRTLEMLVPHTSATRDAT